MNVEQGISGIPLMPFNKKGFLPVAVQPTPVKWWSFSGQAVYHHKELKGYRNIHYNSDVSQLNISMNNRFRPGQSYTAEISGFYTTKAWNDLQELRLPTGRLSAGIEEERNAQIQCS